MTTKKRTIKGAKETTPKINKETTPKINKLSQIKAAIQALRSRTVSQ